MRRSPVFSHDELVCKMMAQPDRLELCLLLTTGQDSEHMIQLEKVVQCSLKEKVGREGRVFDWCEQLGCGLRGFVRAGWHERKGGRELRGV